MPTSSNAVLKQVKVIAALITLFGSFLEGSPLLLAQQNTTKGINAAASFLAAAALKNPGLVSLKAVTLNANATWTLGNQKETGTAVLQAQSDGASSMQLNLDKASRTESRNALGANRACLWGDSKGTHQLNDVDCSGSVAWFAPMLAVQPISTILELLSIADDGQVTRDTGTFRQISYYRPMQGTSPDVTNLLTGGTRISVLYDPQTLLPESLEYLQHADTDLNTTFPVRIVYSNYQILSGIPIPYQIDRYVSGVLQLSLTVTSASTK